MSIPLILLALVFAVAATVEWDRLPVIARIYVAVASAFAIGAGFHPGASVVQAVGADDGIAIVLEAARMIAFGAVMVSVATALRGLALRD
jgi:hypothetical protein